MGASQILTCMIIFAISVIVMGHDQKLHDGGGGGTTPAPECGPDEYT